MQVTQVYNILNTMTKEILGDSVVVNEDLSNVVDIGKAFENLDNGYDKYVRTLNNHIGKMVFVDRVYESTMPKILVDAWEYGSIVEKVRADLPEATENESWNLQNGASYDPNIFKAPHVSAKFFNNMTTFDIQISFTSKQVKQSFSNAIQLNAFYSMIYTAIQKSMTVKMDSLIQRTINSGIAETMYDAFPNGTYTGTGNKRAVNLLALYNARVPEAKRLTAEQALTFTDTDFLKFCAFIMGKYVDRLGFLSTSYNIEGTDKFTPKEYLHFVLLSDFKRSADVYLQSETFHNEFTRMPDAEVVPYWQGEEIEHKIMCTTPTGHTVTLTGIVGVMFDKDAMVVANTDRRVTVQPNPVAEFWNEWHKVDASYFLDLSENIVTFFIA